MKKCYVLIISILILLIIGLLPYLASLSFSNSKIRSTQNSKDALSVFVKQKDGNYTLNNNFSWQERGYSLNTTESQCNNGNLSWNNTTKEVILDSEKSNNCKLYFDFDYTNYINDLSGNGNNGEFNNVQDSNGLKIDDGYINTHIVNHDFSKGLSFVIKLKINDLYKGMAFIGNWEGLKGGGIFHSGENICFDLYELNPVTICSSKTYLANILYTLIATYDNKEMKLYVIEGENIDKYSLLSSGSVTAEGNVPITIGMDPDLVEGALSGHNHSNITVNEALLFDRVLSEDEISKNYVNEINPENRNNLLFWYKYTN